MRSAYYKSMYFSRTVLFFVPRPTLLGGKDRLEKLKEWKETKWGVRKEGRGEEDPMPFFSFFFFSELSFAKSREGTYLYPSLFFTSSFFSIFASTLAPHFLSKKKS